MRVVVLGAVAIGGVVGARLAMAGTDVTLVARGAHAQRLRTDGLRLEWSGGTEVLRLPVADEPAQIRWRGDEVVLLSVKGQDTEVALRALAASAPPHVAVACLQNGVDNERQVLRVFPTVYAVCVMLPASHLEPGVVQAHSSPITGILELGRYPAGVDAGAEELAGALRSATFEADALADAMRWKYRKLLANLDNAVQALFAPSPAAAELSRRARREGDDCLAVAGIPVVTDAEWTARRGDRIRFGQVGGRPRGGSSWQSLARGTGSIEADSLNGEIVLLGRLHGIPTPVNALLQRMAGVAARHGAEPGSGSADAALAQLTG